MPLPFPMPPPLVTPAGLYGLLPGDDFNSLSLGFDRFGPPAFVYVSVAPGATSLCSMPPGPINLCSEAGLVCPAVPQVAADVLFAGTAGAPAPNFVAIDGDGASNCAPPPPPTLIPALGLDEPPPFPGDDVDVLEGCSLRSLAMRPGGPPPAFMTLKPGSATLALLGVGPADVLIASPPAPPGLFVPAAALGLAPGDVIDALAVDVVGGVMWFSLAPASPTLVLLGATPGDILSTGPGFTAPPFIAHKGAGVPPLGFDLAATDDVDALMVIPDPDGDLVNHLCDNCPAVPNNDQSDTNGDGFGDLCQPACSDGVDNDGDGATDYPADPGCTAASDPSEKQASLVCDDGVDNDGDTKTDFPVDPGCSGLTGVKEAPACNDGLDNDGDTLVDLADPGCGGFASNDFETPPSSCGLLGIEPFVLGLGVLARRRRAARRAAG